MSVLTFAGQEGNVGAASLCLVTFTLPLSPVSARILSGSALLGAVLAVGISSPVKAQSSVVFSTPSPFGAACKGGAPGATTAVTCPNPPNADQTRPVQLSSGGAPIKPRSFQYFDLKPGVFTGDLFTGATGWQWSPLVGITPPEGRARFDYEGGTSDTTNGSIVWKDVELNFRPFELVGPCSACGLRVDRLDLKTTGEAIRQEQSGGGSVNSIASVVTPISFGGVYTGTIAFSGNTNVEVSGLQTSTGEIALTAISPDTESVPGPLPILGVGAAFSFSRRLRTRIKRAA